MIGNSVIGLESESEAARILASLSVLTSMWRKFEELRILEETAC